jgi:hypothetical protein
MATPDYALPHAPASATLAPQLTYLGEVAKFIRTKPVGAVGGAIILAMLAIAAAAGTVAPNVA